jgi:hypothetical protein
MNAQKHQLVDIGIVGGGLAGSALASALGIIPSDVRLLIIDLIFNFENGNIASNPTTCHLKISIVDAGDIMNLRPLPLNSYSNR